MKKSLALLTLLSFILNLFPGLSESALCKTASPSLTHVLEEEEHLNPQRAQDARVEDLLNRVEVSNQNTLLPKTSAPPPAANLNKASRGSSQSANPTPKNVTAPTVETPQSAPSQLQTRVEQNAKHLLEVYEGLGLDIGSKNPGTKPAPVRPTSKPTLPNGNVGQGVGKALKSDKGLKLQNHKNSLEYEGDTHVYSIHKVSDGKVHKVGQSSQGVRKRDGASKRAEQQVRKLMKETGERYESKIRKNFDNKKKGLDYETSLIKRTRSIKGPQSLPGNKNNH